MTSPKTGREITAKLEPKKLEEEWKKKEPKPLEVHAVVKIGAKTDLGRVRENNEDKFEFFEPEDQTVLAARGSFYAVADGMGGHAAGQIASELALKTIVDSYYADTAGDMDDALVRAARQANSLIYDTAAAIVDRVGMGTTLTAAVVRGDELHVLQVGDSRAYLIRNGKISQITEDHSWVQEQVRMGTLTEAEAEYSPFKNVITRSLGAAPDVEPDIFRDSLREGDVVLLCSDGLSGNASKEDMLRLANGRAPSVAAKDLVDLANENGGSDNITVLIFAVKEMRSIEPTTEPPKKPRRKGLKRLFSKE